MQYSDKLRIQYLIIQDYNWSSQRRIKYRIINSQLPWWKRNFIFNPWHKLTYTNVSGHTYDTFSKDEFQILLKPLKTLGEIREYISKQNQRIEEYNDGWD